MRDFTDQVGDAHTRNRYPFDRMTAIGDMFFAGGVDSKSLSTTMSLKWQGSDGRRFAAFKVAGGTRIFLVDIVGDTRSAAE